jgi:lantibiotic modifying enzyme
VDPPVEVAEAFAAAGISLDAAHRRTDDPPVQAERTPSRPHMTASPRRLDPLECAMAIGRRLVSSAVRHDGRCTWMTAEVEALRGRRVRLRPCDATLYDGTAGIALALAELSAASGDGWFAAEARAAIRHALDGAAALGAGLHGGLGGVAYAAIRVGGLLDDEETIAAGLGLLDGLRGGDERIDLMGGTAGSLVARLLHPGPRRTNAHALADEVLRAARRRGSLRSWRGDPSDCDDLTGMAHGTAGIGLVLAEAGHALNRRDLVDAALGAFAYERAHRRQQGAWLDLRGRSRMGAPGPSERVAWCHGAAGIALSRVRASNLLDDHSLAADAIDALNATSTHVRAALISMGTDFGLCHGLSGLAEVLLEGARALPHRAGDWESAARAVVSEGLARHHRTGMPWPCGPAGELPGLMTGIAGIAHFLLRTVDPSVPSVLHIGPPIKRALMAAPQPTLEVIHVA